MKQQQKELEWVKMYILYKFDKDKKNTIPVPMRLMIRRLLTIDCRQKN